MSTTIDTGRNGTSRAAGPEPRRAGPSARYLEIVGRRPDELEAMMRRGETPDAAAMAGSLYRGCNQLLPASAAVGPGVPAAIAKLAGIRKFIKGFDVRPAGGHGGFNLPTLQNALEEEWHGKPDDERARRFGFYSVDAVDPESRDNVYLQALLLDYGKGDNPPWDPSRLLRDYVVRIDPGSDDLLLGKAYLALGPARVPVGYFVLERKG